MILTLVHKGLLVKTGSVDHHWLDDLCQHVGGEGLCALKVCQNAVGNLGTGHSEA